MLKLAAVLICMCVQVFLVNTYIINPIQRPLWFGLDGDSNDDLYSKILQAELFLNEVPTSASAATATLVDPTDVHPQGLQKRGRQCLWKVCSWALDKRDLRSSVSTPLNSIESLSKLFY